MIARSEEMSTYVGQLQISLNLKLSNVELPDGSNMTMDRLPVPQK